MSRTALAVLGLAVVSGCDTWLTKPSLYNSVPVVVSRRNGEPIPSVGLTLYTGQRPMGYGVTSADGRFVFTRVPQGVYGVAATLPAGYDVISNFVRGPSSLVSDGLEVAADTLSPVRFTLLKPGPGTLVVRVVQQSGPPLVNVPVTAYQPSKIDGQATTDSNGVVRFPSVPFGVHGVVVTRPYLYRDFRAPGDSLVAVKQDIVVDEGSRDSLVFVLPKCSGTLRAIVLDEAGIPVPRANVVFYSTSQQLGVVPTGVNGNAVYTDAPCGFQLGVTLSVPPGYSITQGRNTSFFDGIMLSNGSLVDVAFRLRRI